ncbi:MAG: ribosome maturation factor RimM [Phormidesmis sp.]
MVTVETKNNTTDQDWLLIGRIVGAHGLNGHVKVYPESDFPERFIKPGERWLQKPGQAPVSVQIINGRYLEGTKNYLVKLAGVEHRDQAEGLRSAQLLVPVADRLPLDPGEFHVEDLIGLKVVVKSDQTELGTITNIFTTGHDLLEVTLIEQTSGAEQAAESAVESTVESTVEMTEKGAIASSQIASSQIASSQIASSPAEPTSIRAKAAEKLRRKAKRAKKKKKPKTLLIPFVEDIVPIVDLTAGRIEITPPPGLIDL